MTIKEMEKMEEGQAERHHRQPSSRALQRSLQALNFIVITISGCGGPLLLRLYFLKGGRRKWLSGWMQNAGWPIVLLPLAVSYCIRRRRTKHTTPFLITPPLFLASAGLGVLNGINALLYAYGMSYLPVSTSSLLAATQLGFTALFAYFLVRQKFTGSSVNAVVLLTIGAVLLGVNSDGDRPQGEGRAQYYAGFVMTLGAAVVYGLILPLVEVAYARAEQAVTYALVMEMQMVMGLFATLFCTAGMIVNRDFQAIAREASEFELGEARYYVLLAFTVITWQMFFLATFGAIFLASALLTGVITTALIPVTEVLAVFFFHESFTGNKGVALGLSLWGFASYFYGEFKESNKKKNSDPAGPI